MFSLKIGKWVNGLVCIPQARHFSWEALKSFYFVYFASENPFLNVHQFDAPKMWISYFSIKFQKKPYFIHVENMAHTSSHNRLTQFATE